MSKCTQNGLSMPSQFFPFFSQFCTQMRGCKNVVMWWLVLLEYLVKWITKSALNLIPLNDTLIHEYLTIKVVLGLVNISNKKILCRCAQVKPWIIYSCNFVSKYWYLDLLLHDSIKNDFNFRAFFRVRQVGQNSGEI